jgi:hypothetical protein
MEDYGGLWRIMEDYGGLWRVKIVGGASSLKCSIMLMRSKA